MNVDAAQLRRFSSARLRLDADALLAVALAVAQALVVVGSGGIGAGARVAGLLCAAGFVALAWRGCYPLAVLVVTFAAVFAQELIAPHLQSPVLFLAILLASYSLGAHGRTRALVAGVALGLPGVAGGHALGPPVPEFSDVSSDVFFFGVLVLAPAVVGRIVRARAELAAGVRAANDRLSALREQRLSGAVERERHRIVAELERVMLSGLDAMATHAEVATLGQVTALERAARETLASMRGLLTGLRSASPNLSPSRPLSELHERVALALAVEADPVTRASERPTVRRRGALLSTRRIDIALGIVAALLACGALVTTITAGALHGPRAIDALLALLAVMPIAWARRATRAATALAIAALLAYAALGRPSDPLSWITPTGLLLCFPFALGTREPTRGAVAGLLVCLATAALLPVVDPHASGDVFSELPAAAAVIAGAWAAGRVLGSRSRLLAGLTDTTIKIEREQQALAHGRLAQERDRVARELHDAFAHAMTVIVLQAGAARRVWNTDTALAREHAGVLRETLRDALGELHELILAIAHDPQHAPAALRIEGLVQRARSSGMVVELAIDGQHRTAGEVERAAYRIVQEALTNAAKHAPGAAVCVRIHHAPNKLSITVDNGPPLRASEAGNGSGQGLRGMRERAEACGGTIAALPSSDGGFRIAASLPLSSP